MSLHVTSPYRPTVVWTTDDLRAASSIPLTKTGKLDCCLATPISILIKQTSHQLSQRAFGRALSSTLHGRFYALDGAVTQSIAYADICSGFIVHSTSDGHALPHSLGGPLRVVFMDGSPVTSICGKPTPLTLKGVVRLEIMEYDALPVSGPSPRMASMRVGLAVAAATTIGILVLRAALGRVR